jgi:hypothetical protein
MLRGRPHETPHRDHQRAIFLHNARRLLCHGIRYDAHRLQLRYSPIVVSLQL